MEKENFFTKAKKYIKDKKQGFDNYQTEQRQKEYIRLDKENKVLKEKAKIQKLKNKNMALKNKLKPKTKPYKVYETKKGNTTYIRTLANPSFFEDYPKKKGKGKKTMKIGY